MCHVADASASAEPQLSAAAIARMIDISCVQAQCSEPDVRLLATEAMRGNYIAAHVLPSWLPLLRRLLDGSTTNAGSPVGFPSGGTATQVKVFEARWLIDSGVQEMDVVMNIGLVKSGRPADASADVAAVLEAVDRRVPVKVILEVGLLEGSELESAAQAALDAGATSLKTGTGWTGIATDVSHIRRLRAFGGPSIEIKASGGVRSLEQLLALHAAGATRFGVNSSYAQRIVKQAEEAQ
jgi:deoxyribose-phosphate aldolase